MSASPEQPSLPPAPGLPEASSSETARYQPLSLLALVSILLAGGLATLLVVGSIIAVLYRTPLLLPIWLLLVAAAIVVLALFARSQIQNSEGTLSGLGATTWAIRLCLILGPIYGAYYAATYFSVTLQADDFVQRWLVLVSKGEIEEAYWWTVPAAQRPAKAQQTRDRLEIQHNQTTAQSDAPFSRFRRSELVRLMTSGKEPRIEFVTLNNWGFEQGGYQVQATYRVSNTFGSFQILVSAQGIAATTGELRGRQWHILESSSGRLQDSPVALAPAAKNFPVAADLSRRLLEEVNNALGQRKLDRAFDVTLSPEERKQQESLGGPFVPLGLALGFVPNATPTQQEALAVRRRWFLGEIFDVDATRFWAAPGARATILTATRATLLEGLSPPYSSAGARWMLPPRTQPTFAVLEGGDVQLGYDVQMILPRPGSPDQPYMVEGLALIRVKIGPNGPTAMWLDRIDLITARTLPAGALGPR